MEIFVINLDRRPDRLDHISHQLNSLELNFSRVSAVDGRNLCSDDLKYFKSEPNLPRPSNSEFACFLSHRKCWERLLESADQYAVILEDDVFLSKDSGYFLSGTEWIPSGTELLRFETTQMKVFCKRGGAVHVHGRNLNEMRSFHAGTGAYLISKKIAGELLNKTEQYIPAPIDNYLFDPAFSKHHARKIYQLSPAICIQEYLVPSADLNLSGDIKVRSVIDARVKDKKYISSGEKIIREISKGAYKLLRFPFEKRFVVPYE